jgi:hypothetical protein
MASPLFDNLHLRLSRKIQDYVAAAATNGAKVTSLLRTDYLNQANKFIQRQFRKGGADVWLQGLVKVQTPTFAAAGTAVATDYSYWLSCKGTSEKLLFVSPEFKARIVSKENRNWKNVFTIETGKLYAFQNYIQLTASTGELKYIQNDNRASAGDTADIAIDDIWYDALVHIASTYHSEDRLGLTFADGEAERINIVKAVVG